MLSFLIRLIKASMLQSWDRVQGHEVTCTSVSIAVGEQYSDLAVAYWAGLVTLTLDTQHDTLPLRYGCQHASIIACRLSLSVVKQCVLCLIPEGS